MKIIKVKVKLKQKQSSFEIEPVSPLFQNLDVVYIAKLKSLPIDGKANVELINLISKYFGVAKKNINIKTGKTSTIKIIQID